MKFFFSRHPEWLLSVSPFLDGYLTVAAGFLIAHVFLSASSLLTSLFAGGFMAGTFLGSLFIGRFADRYGRSFFCRTLLLVPAMAATAACLTDNLMSVTMLQSIIGLFIGADQPVSQAIVTEVSPSQERAKRLSFLMLAWYVGALTAIATEYLLLLTATLETGAWHAFYGVPALLCLVSLPLRYRLMKDFQPTRSSLSDKPTPSLKPYRKALLFCCGFWTCQTLPVTAVMFYSPVILESVAGNPNQLFQITLIYLGFLAGTLPMLKFGNLLPARGVLMWTFAAMAVGLGGIACDPSTPVLGVCFGLYAVAYGIQSTLDYSLPNQLFPTTVRTTAVGIVFAVSRVASVAAAAGFPLLLQCCNVSEIFVAGTVISATGIVITLTTPTTNNHYSPEHLGKYNIPL